MRLLFCLFADSVGLLARQYLPQDDRSRTARSRGSSFASSRISSPPWPSETTISARSAIHHFNGGLFRAGRRHRLRSDPRGLGHSSECRRSWIGAASSRPSSARSSSASSTRASAPSLGAHYTSREDILLILEPVVMAPLRRRWDEVKAGAEEIAAAMETASSSTRAKLRAQLEAKLLGWMDELAARPHPRSRLRQRQFPLRGAVAAARPVERGAVSSPIDHHPTYLALQGRPVAALRHRDQRLRA